MARRGRPRTRKITERDIKLLFDGLTFDQVLSVMGDDVILKLGGRIGVDADDPGQVKAEVLRAWMNDESLRKPIHEFLLDWGWSILGVEVGRSSDFL